ncbi:unnamed protein product [Lepeophtheirus salmonis]|uniref:(salmon louse) hypothetical protein n=1 Tax=Lepeophtheirus salmonis TaxID=72036 RepID=A0A7R8GZ52_LEPSM|nr:unnamed protein product [Lepeophtheirus salmonis]CAF2759508.1 unnamed protein product [Lepeophtheirus salmonis]
MVAVDPTAEGDMDAYWEYKTLCVLRIYKCTDCLLSHSLIKKKTAPPMPKVMEFVMPKNKDKKMYGSVFQCPYTRCRQMKKDSRSMSRLIYIFVALCLLSSTALKRYCSSTIGDGKRKKISY